MNFYIAITSKNSISVRTCSVLYCKQNKYRHFLTACTLYIRPAACMQPNPNICRVQSACHTSLANDSNKTRTLSLNFIVFSFVSPIMWNFFQLIYSILLIYTLGFGARRISMRPAAYQWGQPHINEARHISMRPAAYQWGQTHINEASRISMRPGTYQY